MSETQLNLTQRFAQWLYRITGLASVTPISVGQHNDGLTQRTAGTEIDKPWFELYQEFTDAREAWRQNPLARRLVGLITSHTVGASVSVQSDYKPLQQFIDDFWQRNQMDLRIVEWSDELSRAGEIFPVLFTNPLDGTSRIRAVPACIIEDIDYAQDDYEDEIRYKETTPTGAPEIYWTAAAHADEPDTPAMLHYTINRPLGALRGESDLAPILPWLRRYSRWLEDRVRLNAAVRSFLWIIHAPARLRPQLEERYRRPPDPGSVIIAEKDAEEWTAVTPNLQARDAKEDGRAIRWMIVAGGPGTGLLDLGEGEDSNLATGTVMTVLRRRFLRRRQAYMSWILRDIILCAYHRNLMVTNTRRRKITAADIMVITPDISPEDNNDLATAAREIAISLTELATITGTSPAYQNMALRLFTKFAGETLTEKQLTDIISTGVVPNDPETDTDLSLTDGAARRPLPTERRADDPVAQPIQTGGTNGTGI